MADLEVSAEPTKRRKDDEWRERARFIGDLISRIGMPSLFMLFCMVYGGGVLTGYWPSPFTTSERSELMYRDITKQHAYMIEMQKEMSDTHDRQTMVLKEISIVLKEIRCDHKDSDKAKLRCYQRMDTN